MKVTTVRISEEELAKLQKLAKLLSKDKADLMREALSLGLAEIKLRMVIEVYQKGKYSAGRAAEVLGLTLFEFYLELKRRNITVKYGEDRMLDDIQKLGLA